MDEYEKIGLLIEQAREEKGWTQKELADRMGIEVETVRGQEKGDGSLSVEKMMEYFFLLNISFDIAIYEKHAEDALRMERLYRELQELEEEQFNRLYKSVGHIRSWRKSHPDTVTLEDYWRSRENVDPFGGKNAK